MPLIEIPTLESSESLITVAVMSVIVVLMFVVS